MPLEEPAWWYAVEPDARARLLQPVAALYGWVAARRLRRTQPYRSRLPVVCVGNFTAGGTGKTPLALAIARHLLDEGETPVFLTRGFKGRAKGPRWVDSEADTATEVGDEPLLLARLAPVMIARDRRAGAMAIERGDRAASVIVMDDGLQNPALVKDFAIAVVDGVRGLGNGLVIPAGPLRAGLGLQLRLADAILVNAARDAPSGRGSISVDAQLRGCFAGPVLAASPAPTGDTSWIAQRPLVAYAGIGNPERFFALLEHLGGGLAGRARFADHHPFSEADARRLLAEAERHGAALVTTEKDLARLSGLGGARARLREASRALAITLAFEDRDADRLADLLRAALATGGYRAGLSQGRGASPRVSR